MPVHEQFGGSAGDADHNAAENVPFEGGSAVLYSSGLCGTRGVALLWS